MSNLLDKWLPQTSQLRLNKFIQLESSKEFLSNDQIPVQASKCKAAMMRGLDQRLRNIIEVLDPQNIQNCQSTISDPLNTTHKVTEKNTPGSEENEKNTLRSEHNLIHQPQKVKTPGSEIPLLITKDGIRDNLDQAAKKSTIKR